MAFFLVELPAQNLPKTETIVTVETRKAQENYIESIRGELNLGKADFEVSTGNFKGAKAYKWNKNYNAFLLHSFVYKKSHEILKSSTLIEQKHCINLGSYWDSSLVFLPKAKRSLKEITDSYDLEPHTSPIQLHNTILINNSEPWQRVFDVVLPELFSSKRILVDSSLGQLACLWNPQKIFKDNFESQYPSRPHNTFNNLMTLKIQDKSLLYKGRLSSNAALFGKEEKSIISVKDFKSLDFEAFVDNVYKKFKKNIKDLKNHKFKILKRHGRWIYLDKGAAFGLFIGLRLNGPHNSKLHIIRYDPNYPNEIDVSIAFLRYEDPKNKLKIGDELQIDPTTYP